MVAAPAHRRFLPTDNAFKKIASVVATLTEEQVKVGTPSAAS